MTSSAACSVAVLVMEPANIPRVWPILIPNAFPSPRATTKSGQHSDKRQDIGFYPRGSGHPLEELPAIENADAVEEHDQAGQPDRPHDRCLGSERADGEADEQNRSDAERKSAQIDLADQVTDADGEKHREDWLGVQDFAGKI